MPNKALSFMWWV